MKKIAVIGANNFQKRLVETAKALSYETHVFAWEEGAVAKDIADFFYPISITYKEEILSILKEKNIEGVCSIASDLAVPTVNFIANNLNLVGNSDNCTEITTDKYKMRKILRAQNIPCPDYQLVRQLDDIKPSILNFPIIIKPIDRSGSRGIYKVENLSELENAINNALEVSFRDQVLVEEYIDGNEYSVEGISQNGVHQILQITEKFTTGAPSFIERGHLSPARVSSDLEWKIKAIVLNSLDVLEIKNGASHTEVKVNSKGEVKVIEAASRMGGDFIGSDMVEITTGYSYVKNVINISVGEQIDNLNPSLKKHSFVGFIFNEKDVIKYEKLKSIYPDIIISENINSELKYVTDSSTRNGYFILEMKDEKIVQEVLGILDM